MRLAIPTLAAVVVLIPATAQAKEVTSARACDRDGCRTITDRHTLRGMEAGQVASAPAQGAPFHRVRLTVDAGEEQFSFTIAYVPSAGLARYRGEGGGYEWIAPTPRALRGFQRLTRGLEPVPGRRLRGVGLVEEEPVAQVEQVAPASAFARDDDDGDGGAPLALLLIPGGLALVAAGARGASRRRGG